MSYRPLPTEECNCSSARLSLHSQLQSYVRSLPPLSEVEAWEIELLFRHASTVVNGLSEEAVEVLVRHHRPRVSIHLAIALLVIVLLAVAALAVLLLY